MPNLNNVSSPSLWQRIWQVFLTTVGTKEFFRIFSPWVKW
ncbi:MAG TPA: heme ABC transporter permease, partial [Psychrobacter sp.]|nr:heme ABC transporter permease [Psychrobacter sp.]